MILGLAGVAIGTVLALVRGGRPRHLLRWRLRWAAPGVAAVTVLVLTRIGVLGGSGVLVAGALGVLVVATAVNRQVAGAGVVALGLTANLVPLLVIGATPVDPRALAAVSSAPTELPATPLLATQVLATDDSPLMVLSSRVPVLPTGDVVSFGDLLVAVGVAAMAHAALRPPSPRRIPVRQVLDDGPLTLHLLDRPAAAARTERAVEVGPGRPVPVPVGWDRDTGGVLPPSLARLRPHRSRAHPTMRLTHH